MRFIRQAREHFNIWGILSVLIIVLVFIPNLIIAVQFFTEPNENWQHIKEYLLKDYIYNSLMIIIWTGVLTTIIGTSLAWLITMYTFPLRNFLKWGLILPLAIPPYIGAYTYHGILNYTGIIQSTLRNAFALQVNPVYFDLLNIQGAIFIFTLFLYPYVYTITRSFLQNQSAGVLENARLLGGNSWSIFFRVGLPISRAAIVGGVVLVILEVLNDYGVVSYFGIQTFSTAIFRTWYGMTDLDSALKLAGTLMIVVIFILVLERLVRGRKQYSYSSANVRPLQAQPLQGKRALLASTYSLGIFGLAFIIPFLQLTQWMLMTYEKVLSPEFTSLIFNSIFVATVAATLIVIIALIVANYSRLYQGVLAKILSRMTTLGYSIPGAAIAIAVITMFIFLDNVISALSAVFAQEPFFILKTSLVMLISAYIIRFLAVGYNSIEAGFEKIGTKYTEASRALGLSTTRTFFKIDLPMLKGSVFSGFILVFVDILKELPLTLFLQPFNFSTLATQAFKYANDERVHEAALASILIILISGLCIFFFHKVLDRD